jgi:aminoglycoside phosphotransferase (APT) family kinase protein
VLDKERPSAAWIAELRRRFPCEAEIDRVLTRKLERRSGPGYRPQRLEDLVAGVESLLHANRVGRFRLARPRWLAGGASKLQLAFDLDWHHPQRGPEVTRLVLRMEPAASLVETSRRCEFEIIGAVHGRVPVPEALWVDAEGEHLPYPAIVYGYVDGVTKPADATSQATGMGTVMARHWRDALGPQFVANLADIHSVPLDPAALTAFDIPLPGTQSIERSLNHWERVWEEDADEDVPLMRLACAWLRANMPPCLQPAIVHGDYRVGNFLFTEHDARVTAILDWEMARIGDPHFDLAWAAHPAYGGIGEDGHTPLVGGFMTEADFHAAWEQASGRRVDRRTLHYYKVFRGWVQGVIALGTGWRVARYGRTHQDALVAWIVGIGPTLLAELAALLENGE